MKAKLFATSGALIASAVAFDRWVAPAIHWIASLPACDALPWARLELAVVLAVLLGGAAALALKARRIWRLQQSPLPDTWVRRRTEVKTGWLARIHALLLFAAAALLCFGPLYVFVRQEFYLVYAFWLPCTEAIDCLGPGFGGN